MIDALREMSYLRFIEGGLAVSSREQNAYKMPLDQQQLVTLGTVAVVWGQIDLFVSYCIARLLGVNPVVAAALMDKMTGGPRIGLLERSAKKATTKELKKRILDFCEVMSGLNERRNDVFHAYWSYYVDDKTGTNTIGAVNARNPSKLFTLEQLEQMLAKLHAQSYEVDSIFRELHGISFAESPVGYHFGEDGSIQALKLVPKPGKCPPRIQTPRSEDAK